MTVQVSFFASAQAHEGRTRHLILAGLMAAARQLRDKGQALQWHGPSRRSRLMRNRGCYIDFRTSEHLGGCHCKPEKKNRSYRFFTSGKIYCHYCWHSAFLIRHLPMQILPPLPENELVNTLYS